MQKLTTHRGYRITAKKGMKHWHPLLEEWMLCIERYCRVASGEDAPFVYNERANIGILAGAAWRCGRTALEEFQYRKGHKNKKKWNGRADLYLSSEETEDMIEAKFSWLWLTRPQATNLRIDSCISDAVADAKTTRGGNSDLRCHGVAFLPVWQKDGEKVELESRIQAVIRELQTTSCHAVAWCFPKEYRHIVNDSGNLTPGVIMAIKNIDYI